MTRKEKELQICMAVAHHAMLDDGLLDTFKVDWNCLYQKIIKSGWQSLADISIDLLYSYFLEMGWFDN